MNNEKREAKSERPFCDKVLDFSSTGALVRSFS